MKLMYHEPPGAERQYAEGPAARALLRRAFTQVTADLDELAEIMPAAIDSIREEKQKLRRRAKEAMQRGEHIPTRIDAEGHPLGGMTLAVVVKINAIILEDGTRIEL